MLVVLDFHFFEGKPPDFIHVIVIGAETSDFGRFGLPVHSVEVFEDLLIKLLQHLFLVAFRDLV